MSTRDVALAKDTWLARPVLTIRVRSQGPFVHEAGKPDRPAFHPEDGIVEDYAFDERGAHLLGVATGGGQMLGISFRGQAPTIGPDVATRPSRRWMADLASSDPVRQIECLMWLSGGHLNSKDWRKSGFSREPVAESVAYETLRSDPSVKARIQRLAGSRNPWVAKRAAFTLEAMAKPLDSVGAPPW